MLGPHLVHWLRARVFSLTKVYNRKQFKTEEQMLRACLQYTSCNKSRNEYSVIWTLFMELLMAKMHKIRWWLKVCYHVSIKNMPPCFPITVNITQYTRTVGQGFFVYSQ